MRRIRNTITAAAASCVLAAFFGFAARASSEFDEEDSYSAEEESESFEDSFLLTKNGFRIYVSEDGGTVSSICSGTDGAELCGIDGIIRVGQDEDEAASAYYENGGTEIGRIFGPSDGGGIGCLYALSSESRMFGFFASGGKVAGVLVQDTARNGKENRFGISSGGEKALCGQSMSEFAEAGWTIESVDAFESDFPYFDADGAESEIPAVYECSKDGTSVLAAVGSRYLIKVPYEKKQVLRTVPAEGGAGLVGKTAEELEGEGWILTESSEDLSKVLPYGLSSLYMDDEEIERNLEYAARNPEFDDSGILG